MDEDIIIDLVDQRKEGDSWDFKVVHHLSTLDLVHDILCLANVIYDGPRYLIFGVDDKCEIVGIPKDSSRTQAEIIDILNNSNLAGGVFPDVTLHDLNLNNQQIQVLKIENLPEKPYYLQKEKKDGKKRLSAGTIYSRVRDRNTSKNGVASINQIENMWKERFGLLLSPLKRFEIYLQDSENWNDNDEYVHYYEPHPEFVIKIKKDSEFIEAGALMSWCRCRPDASGASSKLLYLKYHSTKLHTELLVFFDGWRELKPNTDVTMYKLDLDKKFFYSYQKDSIKYTLYKYFKSRNHNQRGYVNPYVIFHNQQQKESFVEYLETNNLPNNVSNEYRIGSLYREKFLVEEQDINFNLAIKEIFEQWIIDNNSQQFYDFD